MAAKSYKFVANKKQNKFLNEYAITGNIGKAAAVCKIARQTHYDWLEKDSAYEQAFKIARKISGDLLEEEARRRAIEGVDEPVFYKGEICGDITKYSDKLLETLLRAAKPDEYANVNKTELSGTGGGAIEMVWGSSNGTED